MSKSEHPRKKFPTKGRKYKIKSVRHTSVLRSFLTVTCGILFGFLLVFLLLLNPAPDTTKHSAVTLPDNARNFISAENSTDTHTQSEQTTTKQAENPNFNSSVNNEEYEEEDSAESEDEDENSEEPEKLMLTPIQPESQNALPQIQPIPQSSPVAKPTKKLPLWQKNAASVPSGIPKNAAIVAIIIDDIGIDKPRSKEFISLHAPLTLSFITYADDLIPQIESAKKTGKELMLHIPMQPSNPNVNAGPNVLTTDMSAKDIESIVHTSLSPAILQLGIAGANNHMGSKFTSDKDSISAFMHIFKQYDLYFIDSVTHKDSYATASAITEHIATAPRNIFIDNLDDEEYILGQLSKLENVAWRKGYAIGIGHPHDGTIAALKKWIPTLKAKGIYLVPTSAIVKRHIETIK